MDRIYLKFIVTLLFVTGTQSSAVTLKASNQPVVNESLTLNCTYTGNGTVDYFTWNVWFTVLDIVRIDTCQSTYKNDDDYLYLTQAYWLKCPDSKSNSMIFENAPYMSSNVFMSCTAVTQVQNVSSNIINVHTFVPVSEARMDIPQNPVINIKENDVAQFECIVYGFPLCEIRWFKDNVTPLDYTDDMRITENISELTSAEYETVYERSYLNYTAKRTDNGMSIYCTGNNSANRFSVVSTLKPTLFVQVTHCLKEVDLHMVQWEKTDLGKYAFVSCSLYLPELSSLISRRCLENGTWIQPIYDCLSSDVADIQYIIDSINSGNFSKEIGKVLQKASEVIAHQDSDKAFLCKYIDVLTQTLEKVVALEDWAVTFNQSKNLMTTVSNILETMNRMVLQSNSTNLQDTKCYQGVWKLLNIVSAFSTILGGTLDETTSNKDETIQTENVLLQVYQVNSSSSVGLTFPDADKYPDFSQIATLKLSVDSLKGSTLFYGILYKNVSALLAAETTYDSFSFKNGFLNSAVMGAGLENWENNSDFKVTIKFRHLKESDWRTTCSFLSKNSTTWMKEGCYVKTSDQTTTTCECNHLTNFAILMSPWTEIANAYEKKRRKSTSFMNLNRSSKPKKTKYLSTSALNLDNSDTGINSSRLSDNDIASNGRNLANITEMKRFEPIKAKGEEKPISHEM